MLSSGLSLRFGRAIPPNFPGHSAELPERTTGEYAEEALRSSPAEAWIRALKRPYGRALVLSPRQHRIDAGGPVCRHIGRQQRHPKKDRRYDVPLLPPGDHDADRDCTGDPGSAVMHTSGLKLYA